MGNDITNSNSGPLLVSRGASHDPGTLTVRGIRPLKWEDTGIYTYRTPDENGNIIDFHFGVYFSAYAGIILGHFYILSRDINQKVV